MLRVGSMMLSLGLRRGWDYLESFEMRIGCWDPMMRYGDGKVSSV